MSIPLAAPRPPLTHRLEVAAGRLLKIWLAVAAIAAGAASVLVGLRSAGLLPRSEPAGPLYIFAVLCLVVAGFCFLQGRRARSEFGRMRRGNYLARWTYPATDAALARSDAGEDQAMRLKLMFHIPFWTIAVSGVGLAVIGAFAKSDPMLVPRVGGLAVAIAVAAGLAFALPAKHLFGVSRQLALRLDPEAVFTHGGVYTPGRFIPVMDFPTSRRAVVVEAGADGRRWLCLRLRQGTQPVTGIAHTTVGALFRILVPAGREDEANALAAHYAG